MKRATALKVLAGTLVLITLASAFPLAVYLANEGPAGAAGTSKEDASRTSPVGPLPFGPSGSDGSTSSPVQGPAEGSSSLPGAQDTSLFAPRTAASTGSPLLDEVVGAARQMGYDVSLPPLPSDKLPATNPLRPALLAWVAATGSQVSPDDLAAQLARADALPQGLQRDLALVVLSAAQASLLQQAALSKLSPQEVAWVYAHPELAQQLAQGVDTAQTRELRRLAGLVDMKSSVEASLLVLEAVEATRGSLGSYEAKHALDGVPALANDPTTAQLLRLLAQGSGSMGDADKVRFAARVVAAAARLPDPQEAAPVASFPDALQALLKSSSMVPDPQALQVALDRADALPADLQAALATTLVAEAKAIDAANPQFYTPQGRMDALVNVLMASAYALPTLEKYNLYWRDAPSALRVGQWDPETRAGYALQHAALVLSARGDPADLARAMGVLRGAGYVEPSVPARSFVDAYAALASQAGAPPNASTLAAVSQAADHLSPAARSAAAIMMSGAAESARLDRLAFSALTPEDQQWLLTQTLGLDALFAKASPTQADLALMARAATLSEKVNRTDLANAEVVGVLATMQARQVLQGGGYSAQSSDITRAPTLWDRLLGLLPVGAAAAQDVSDDGCVDLTGVSGGFEAAGVSTDCAHDILLRLTLANSLQAGGPDRCDGHRCAFDGGSQEVNDELLVISGTASSVIPAETWMQFQCQQSPQPEFGNCVPGTLKPVEVPRDGSAVVFLDLGGSDEYQRPVAATAPGGILPVALHLDAGGSNSYDDPSSLYGTLDREAGILGNEGGIPTQGSALFGGVAVLVSADPGGADVYQSASHSQGFGRFGLGMVADLGGDDRYQGTNYTQGASAESFNLGTGVLLDGRGDDRYVSLAGQGYGAGGVLVDLGGNDHYTNRHDAVGAPVSGLHVLPGGDIGTLAARDDDHAWLDGPSTLNVGLGVDEEGQTAGPDLTRGVSGVQDYANAQADRVESIAQDSDGDTFPDFIETAFGTDPHSATSYPAGFPRGPALNLPLEGNAVNGNGGPLSDDAPQGTPKGSDKIIDLRLPINDLGSVSGACLGTVHLNTSIVDDSGPRVVGGSSSTGLPSQANLDGANCVGSSATFGPNATGSGTASTPPAGTSPGSSDAYAFRLPAGILAVGDSVATNYSVDYLVAIDLGGNDRFFGVAGGATPIVTAPGDDATDKSSPVSLRQSFLAPTLTLNVDPAMTIPTGTVQDPQAGDCGCDSYNTPSVSYTQGSMYGVLVDTAGSDVYRAGDVSQGAVGGVLLDLAGAFDRYTAGNLSQGASLAGYGTGLNGATGLPNGDGRLPGKDSADRRAVPGLLFDLGSDPGLNVFTAGSNSQGFARGFPLASANGSDLPSGCDMLSTSNFAGGCQQGPDAVGVLLAGDASTSDFYTATGIDAQGVGGGRAVGALVDLGGNDAYKAGGVVSQGAPLGEAFNPSAAANTGSGRAAEPGVGLLVDAGGFDSYSAFDPVLRAYQQRADREDRLTVQRADSPLQNGDSGIHLYADVGVHLDTDAKDPNALLAAVSGSDSPAGTDPNGMLLDFPAARLAIGGLGDTTYNATDYALIVDLGGKNSYQNTGGGFVGEVLASGAPPASPLAACSALSCTRPTLTLYPVSLLFDAGSGASTHSADRSLAQGAGFFSVGVLVDAGGADAYGVGRTLTDSYGSPWLPRAPLVDANLNYGNESEWNVTLNLSSASVAAPLVLPFTSLQDARQQAPFRVAFGNDERNLYVAVDGPTRSSMGLSDPATYAGANGDSLTIDINAGATLRPYDAALGRTSLERIVLGFNPDGTCNVVRSAAQANGAWVSNDPNDAVKGRANCRVVDGRFFAELQRPLRRGLQADSLAFGFTYDSQGFHYCDPLDPTTPSCTDAQYLDRDVAVRMSYHEAATQSDFVYPAGTTDQESAFSATGAAPDGDPSPEMAQWATIQLAQLGQNASAPLAAHVPELTQAASVAGVGILANLGSAGSDGVMTSGARSQSFADYGGLSLLVDNGGSDTYQAGDASQGAASHNGVAVFLESDGDDRYLTPGGFADDGYVPAHANATATFLDLAGNDLYTIATRTFCPGAVACAVLPSDPNSPAPPPHNGVAWASGSEPSSSQGGIGVDHDVTDNLVRDRLAGLLSTSLLGGDGRTTLTITRWDPLAGALDPLKGCADDAPLVPTRDYTATLHAPVLNGTVCLRAHVDLTRNGLPAQAAPGASAAKNDLFVDGVDFLVDGVPVASKLASGARQVEDVVLPFDTTQLRDGIVDLRARAAISLSLSEGGEKASSIAFYDIPPTGAGVVDHGHATSVVSNRPVVDLDVAPRFQGAADGILTPLGAAPGEERLVANYSVSHDADEERLAALMGWRPSGANATIPCVPDPAVDRLCSLLPFYLPSSSGTPTLTTTPSRSAAGGYVTESSGEDKKYSAQTSRLAGDMTIVAKDAFHVHLAQHTGLIPLITDYATHIRIGLVNSTGGDASVGGEKVFLADQTFDTRVDRLADSLPGPAQPFLTPVRDQIASAASLGPGTALAGLARAEACSVTPVCPIYANGASPAPSPGNAVDSQGAGIDNDLAPARAELGTVNQTTYPSLTPTPAFQDFWLDLNDSPALRELGIQPTPDGLGVDIPSGYSLKLEIVESLPNLSVQQTLAGTCVPTANVCGDVEGPFDSAMRQAQAAIATEIAAIPVETLPLSTLPVPGNPLQDQRLDPNDVRVPVVNGIGGEQILDLTDLLDNAILDQKVRQPVENTLGSTFDLGTPISYFVVSESQNGDDTTQSRLDVRVPTEPSTNVTMQVVDASGAVVRTLFAGRPAEGVLPDAASSFVLQSGHVSYYRDAARAPYARFSAGWDGRGDAGQVLPDGVYTLRVVAADKATLPTTATRSVLVDATPPKTVFATRAVVGQPFLNGSAIPLGWIVDERGSGVRSTRILEYTGSGDLRSPANWAAPHASPDKPLAPGQKDFGPDVTSIDVSPTSTPTSYFVAISEDRAGNVEGACTPTDCPHEREAAYAAALKHKLDGGLYAAIREDPGLPKALVAQDEVVGANLLTFLGQDAYFVRAGAPVSFRLCAHDDETPNGRVASVNVNFDYVDPTTLAVLTRSYAASPDASGAPCPSGYDKWAYNGWGSVNGNGTLYPNGVWSASAQVFDQAGNELEVSFQNVVLDGKAPDVQAQPPLYPEGQSAVKPGDTLSLRILAGDAFGVADGIRFDARSLNRTGILDARPARDGSVVYREVTFKVDKPGLVDDSVYPVTATVYDNAGNPATVTFQIPVSFQSFQFNLTAAGAPDVRVVNASYDSLTLAWNTTVPTTGYVRYGTSNATMVDGPRNETLNWSHVVTVSGLSPSTRYLVRAGSATAGGLVNLSDALSAATSSALFLEGVSPAAGSALSGAVPLQFRGGLHGSAGLVRYTLEVQPAPGAPWSFYTVRTEGGADHALTFNSSRYLDGAAYRLRVTAEAGPDPAHVDTASLVLGPFLLDNTPPTVDVVSPLVATREAQPTLKANVADNLAGFGAAPATLAIDGDIVSTNLTASATAAGASLAYALPFPLSPGPHAFDLRVVDKAGNLDEETWTVVVDDAPPVAVVNPASFAPGTAAAKAGGTVTLNLTLTDESGIALAIADTSGLSGQKETKLVRLPGTDLYAGTAPVTLASPAALVSIPIVATDLAGNELHLVAQVPVDNVAPSAGEPTPGREDYTTAQVRVDTSEPVLLVGNATAPGSPAVSAATATLQRSPTLSFAGLLPSRTYSYTLDVVDAAGNAVRVSGTLATKVDAQAPTKVGPLSVVDLLNGTLRLSWPPATDNVAVAFYRVYRSDDAATFRPVAEVQGTTFDDSGLALEKPYTYQVVAVDYGNNEGPVSETLRASATALPRLTAGAATPTLGSATTLFRYVVTYMSPGGVAPTYVHLILDGVPQNMTRVEGGSLASGVQYVYETRLSPERRDAPHTYAFEASDGRYTVSFPDGKAVRGPLVSAEGAAAGPAAGLAAFAQRVPMGGVALVTTAAVAAVGIAALAMRRKKEGSK